MAHQITEICVSCGSCAPECPMEAIKPGPDRFVINPALCTDCGTCSMTCPEGAIVEARS